MAKRQPEQRPAGDGGDSAHDASTQPPAPAAFPIVGVGASAGGLEAFTQLLNHLSADSGMAFVLIQHLDPTHKSFLCEALARTTRMPISQAQHDDLVQADHVYVIPPDADVSIEGGRLRLSARADGTGKFHLPIDFFFATLAADRGSQAIGVVLSGTASDGTEGLKAIKAEGGIAMVQDPTTAKFAGMPQSAVDAAIVDYALPIPELAAELVRLSQHPYLRAGAPSVQQFPWGGEKDAAETSARTASAAAGPETTLKIMAVVKNQTGVDFSEYKSPTFDRRLARRMALRRIEGQQNYLALLKTAPDEVTALCEDALIHVSSFFRDPETFEVLRLRIIPEILKHKGEDIPLRIWVPGCSTGEEVYSLAMTVLDAIADSPHPRPLQLFGTDVSELAIRVARAGQYSDGAMRGVSDEQRRRYFSPRESGFRINKNVRDLCVFVRHDLARDPPFSKIDLLSCRNVLIYFGNELQKRVIPTFHYALNQPGFLVVGRSEHISGFGHLFFPVDKSVKIFARSLSASNLRFAPRVDLHAAQSRIKSGDTEPPRRSDEVGRHLDNLLLARYAPAGVLINERMEILQFRGQTGPYLQPAPGEPQNNLVKMARGGLLAKLRSTLAKARADKAPVRTKGVEIDQDGVTRKCDLVVLPFAGLPDIKERLFIVLFEDAARSPAPSSGRGSARATRAKPRSAKDARRIPMLEHELLATTEYLHSVMKEHSRTSEDLGTVNEELISGNEELQSLNEELETAKEELQSTNEELTTVNDELHHRNLEVGQINTDLVNLLETVDIPIVILDKERHIRRFTPKARTVLNLLPTDVARRFDEIKPNIDLPDMDHQIGEAIATFEARESDVRDRSGRWHRLQIRPFKRPGGDTDGAIVSLFDIDALKNHLTEAQQAKDEAERADRAKDEFLAVLSHELRTPLSSLLMQAQLLRQSGLHDEKQKAACDAIERSVKMQTQLVDDLLDVSRIVNGKMKVDLNPMDLAAVVKTTVSNVAALAAKKSIALQLSVVESVGPVLGDRIRLEQVVSNLLINAIKFTPIGGRVQVSLESAGGLVRLKVSDTGMGIEPSFLPRIFNRLTQKDGSSTRAHNGLGLGLAIVRHLVDAHGGTVRAESPGPGQGSTFHVTLPLLATAPARGVAGPDVAAGEGPRLGDSSTWGRLAGRRILVLEDDEGIRQALADMLTMAGATVRIAESATVGMTVFQQFQPHVLLCDIAMPGEDGHEFIRKIRALGSANGGNTPALALTALAGVSNQGRALSSGFQHYLVKPVEMGALTSAVASLLESDGGGQSGQSKSEDQQSENENGSEDESEGGTAATPARGQFPPPMS
ncbi:MAG TPA: chemotaxis protein CheB [Polyangia bacterium]|nr:chemotaxis protein CheB [Polyangia bacterium]